MSLFVFEAIVESERPSVQPQEGQPEPAALGRPSGDLGVKAARRRARADARAVGALPSRALDTKTLIKQFIQSFGAIGDLERCVSLFLEPSAAAAKFAPNFLRSLLWYTSQGPSVATYGAAWIDSVSTR